MEKILKTLQQDFHGTGLEYIWKEVPKVSNIESEDTAFSKNVDENTIIKKYDWTSLYGTLEEGEYEFILSTSEMYYIRIGFKLDKNGEVLDIKTTFS